MAHCPPQRPPERPTIAEMGCSVEQLALYEAQAQIKLYRAHYDFQRGYVQGWWWGFTCGGCSITALWFLVYTAWAAWRAAA